eukprot:scaffold1200_cov60-Phaeocystis_antarctica.AAC.2
MAPPAPSMPTCTLSRWLEPLRSRCTKRNAIKACIDPAERTHRSRGARHLCGWPACTSGSTHDSLVQGICDRYWVEF